MKGTPKYFSELYAEERASGFGYRASATPVFRNRDASKASEAEARSPTAEARV